MKKIINGSSNIVEEMLEGFLAAHPRYYEPVSYTHLNPFIKPFLTCRCKGLTPQTQDPDFPCFSIHAQNHRRYK